MKKSIAGHDERPRRSRSPLTACSDKAKEEAEAAKAGRGKGRASDQGSRREGRASREDRDAGRRRRDEQSREGSGRRDRARRPTRARKPPTRRCRPQGRRQEVTQPKDGRPAAVESFSSRELLRSRTGRRLLQLATYCCDVLGEPPRQRPPLLPVLLAARARQVEHRIAVARAVDVDLRVAQVRRPAESRTARGTRRARPPRACARRRASPRARPRVRVRGCSCTRRSRRRKSRGRRHVEQRRRTGTTIASARRTASRKRFAARARRRCPPRAIRRRRPSFPSCPRRRRTPRSEGNRLGLRESHCVDEPCGSASCKPTRCRLPASHPAILVASVVLPLPPFGLATRIVCTKTSPSLSSVDVRLQRRQHRVQRRQRVRAEPPRARAAPPVLRVGQVRIVLERHLEREREPAVRCARPTSTRPSGSPSFPCSPGSRARSGSPDWRS